jgi:hypothetical protein
MDEIRLMERLKDKRVADVCVAVEEVAEQFSLRYCTRNDCQHVSSNMSLAEVVRLDAGDMQVQQLVEHPQLFGNLRYLLRQVIESRGLKPAGMSPYNPKIEPIEFRAYATADDFCEKVA